MTYGNKVKSLVTTGILSAAAMSALAGCSPGVYEDDDDDRPVAREVTCVDQNDVVVADEMCRADGTTTSGGSYFFFLGNLGGNYQPGQRVPRSTITRGQKISPVDRTARVKAGLPASGKVSSGTRISGGIGTGAVGRGAGS